MKCVCGYEHEADPKGKATVGDEPFIEIQGTFLMESKYSEAARRVRLYACPECNTVQLDRW